MTTQYGDFNERKRQMNNDVRETILEIVESPLVVSCLEIAELFEPDDFANFSHTNVDILENYIRCRTSVMEAADRVSYLTTEFIHHPDKFMFTPGVRNRLLKAAKLVSKNVYESVFESNQSSDCDSNEMSLDSNNNNSSATHPAAIKSETQINLISDNNNPIGNQFLSTEINNQSIIQQNNINRARHLQNMDKYYNDIVKNAAKNFIECHLQPEIDFHLSIPENDSSDLIGIYHCHFCTDKKKSMTKIKFRFSKYNSVIYSNINSHLKTHFQYVLENSDRKRPKLSNNSGSGSGGGGGHLQPSLLSERGNIELESENKLEIEL